MSAGQPLVGSITLPPAFQEALGEYRKALKSLRQELKDVEREAKEQLKNSGIIDHALLKKRDALRQVEGGLQDLHDNQMAEKAEAAAKAEQAHHAKYAIDLARTAGFRVDMPMQVTGGVMRTASTIGDFANAAKAVGLTSVAANIGKVESAIAEGAKWIGKSPAFMLATGALSVGIELAQNRIEANVAEAERTSFTAQTIMQQGGAGTWMERAQGLNPAQMARVVDRQNAAEFAGRTGAPLGWLEMLGDPYGAINYTTKAQTDYAKELQEHAARMEQHAQTYGIDSAPNKAQVETMARRSHGLKYDLFKNWSGAIGYGAKWLYYAANGQGDEYAQQTWDRERRDAENKVIGSAAHQRKTREDAWNEGTAGAIRRVVENEKRRWLRAVETDRIVRYNSWGMQ